MSLPVVLSWLALLCLGCLPLPAYSWGFYAHRLINRQAVFLLPPSMLVLYKPLLPWIEAHAVDPDKRRYLLPEEKPRHYIDLDRYGPPFDSLPRHWSAALARYPADSLQKHGILPWWVQTVLQRLTAAFREKDKFRILRYSADIGHYIGDAHVPLHACSNYNGQLTGQHGIHAFWETRIPELLAPQAWDFFIGPAPYLEKPGAFIWSRLLESAAAADTVLRMEKALRALFPREQQYAFEERNGQLVRQYSTNYTLAFDRLLGNMVERRMRQSILAVAAFWYTAWVNAGQPALHELAATPFTEADLEELSALDRQWREKGGSESGCH
ncbi:MAG: zinc dependent phospholipase C family protein [Candidatus Pseudobacter hemicellulosilyticus]|uniref:Zinc dependent phospholipase C family protein n=1 Tax=Candidatus Pseudobacter hemicellulosilyticus TaxID=3121375 RepID=A0AAJ5WV85_9BACT|nr:MAG: zinc dependent phospholipase C family protein [Pseudobacter sp.]